MSELDYEIVSEDILGNRRVLFLKCETISQFEKMEMHISYDDKIYCRAVFDSLKNRALYATQILIIRAAASNGENIKQMAKVPDGFGKTKFVKLKLANFI